MCIIHSLSAQPKLAWEDGRVPNLTEWNMKAALVVESGQAPVYGEFTDPAPAPGKSLIRVTASSISHVTRSRALATHYSADRALLFIPGIDGTGIAPDGRRLYFL